MFRSTAKQMLFIAVLGLSIAPSHDAWAACTRAEVDYYLKLRFTREQVVAICTGERPRPKQRHEEKASKEDSKITRTPATASPALDEASGLEDFLRSAIDGYDVRLTPEMLQYTRRTCIEYGPYNEFGIKTEACPDVRYSIERVGIKVEKIKKAFALFGNYTVTVTGRVERKILTLDNYQPLLQSKLQSYLEAGNKTVLPMRDEVSRERLEAALREIPR